MKTRQICKTVMETIPWERKSDVPDLHKIGDDINVKYQFVQLAKGAKIAISLANEAADAIEIYEAELQDDICVYLESDKISAKILRKVDDDPL